MTDPQRQSIKPFVAFAVTGALTAAVVMGLSAATVYLIKVLL